jgi:hypothetical protein
MVDADALLISKLIVASLEGGDAHPDWGSIRDATSEFSSPVARRDRVHGHDRPAEPDAVSEGGHGGIGTRWEHGSLGVDPVEAAPATSVWPSAANTW